MSTRFGTVDPCGNQVVNRARLECGVHKQCCESGYCGLVVQQHAPHLNSARSAGIGQFLDWRTSCLDEWLESPQWTAEQDNPRVEHRDDTGENSSDRLSCFGQGGEGLSVTVLDRDHDVVHIRYAVTLQAPNQRATAGHGREASPLTAAAQLGQARNTHMSELAGAAGVSVVESPVDDQSRAESGSDLHGQKRASTAVG